MKSKVFLDTLCGHKAVASSGRISFGQKELCQKRQPFSIFISGVEVWRGGVGEAYPLADPFVCRCLTSLAVPLIPHPAHRTGRAERPHPALGERLTVTPTENCSSVW